MKTQLGQPELFLSFSVPSALWCCWLGGSKGIQPVKTEWWGAGMVICLERDADLHMAQLMPLPLTVSCFSKIQIGFTFLVPAYPGSPGKRAIKRVYVCMYVQPPFSKSIHLYCSLLTDPVSFITCSYNTKTRHCCYCTWTMQNIFLAIYFKCFDGGQKTRSWANVKHHT